MMQSRFHIPYLPLQAVTRQHLDEIRDAVARVVSGGWYLQGEACAGFEREYAEYIGTRHCVGCANGLDALTLIFRAYKEMGTLHDGDEVIVPANTYIASILSITENGLVPVLVEPDPETLQIDGHRIEKQLTSRTRAILLVHLYGRNAYTSGIGETCRRHRLLLVEDNAQAQGCLNSRHKPPVLQPANASIENRDSRCCGHHSRFSVSGFQPKRTGALGHAAAHSFYPGKNLGALGDAGAVTTDDPELATAIRTLANYGSSQKYVFVYRGRNSRLDEIQAAVLSVKLKYLDADNIRRKCIAGHYYGNIDNPLLTLPGKTQWETAVPDGIHDGLRNEDCVYHIFPVLCERRDELQRYLTAHGVGTMIHYPIPPHQQICYKEWNSLSLPVTEHIHRCELSIPCNQTMSDTDVAEVCRLLNDFDSEA